MTTDRDLKTFQSISKEDLFLLLDAYANTVQLNTTLLEQQKKLLEQHNDIIEKQKYMTDKVTNILEKLNDCATESINVQANLSNEINNIILKQTENRASDSQEHGVITNKLYVSMVGMITIIIALMAITFK